MAAVLGHRIVVDHGVHVAGADEKARRGSPSTLMLAGSSNRLADDAHFVAVRVEDAADDGHAKARMVHVGIAADVDEVALVPAARVHIGAADGEELVAARSPGADGCRLDGCGLCLTAALLLLALFALLTALVVLSVLSFFATILPVFVCCT